jgi:hypothetical protein
MAVPTGSADDKDRVSERRRAYTFVVSYTLPNQYCSASKCKLALAVLMQTCSSDKPVCRKRKGRYRRYHDRYKNSALVKLLVATSAWQIPHGSSLTAQRFVTDDITINFREKATMRAVQCKAQCAQNSDWSRLELPPASYLSLASRDPANVESGLNEQGSDTNTQRDTGGLDMRNASLSEDEQGHLNHRGGEIDKSRGMPHWYVTFTFSIIVLSTFLRHKTLDHPCCLY